MVAFRGTKSPTLSEVKNQGPPQYLTTGSRYGYAFVGVSHQAVINVAGLTAGTDYVFYAFVEDRGGNINGDVGFLYFSTTSKTKSTEI